MGEGGLARARDAGEDDEGAAGDVDVGVLEVVLVGAADADEAARGCVGRGIAALRSSRDNLCQRSPAEHEHGMTPS